MEDIFNERKRRGFKGWLIDHQVGLLGTAIFHLLILILVLALKLNPSDKIENMVYLEMMEPPKVEDKQAKMDRLVEEILKKTEHKNAQSPKNTPSNIRNVAVNSDLDKLTDKLVDDKYGKSNSVYDEARQLEQRMKANQELYKKAKDADKIPNTTQAGGQTNSRSSSDKAYKGASVLSYSLAGRQGTYLPVPAYLCEGGGDIVVDIVVNQKGFVTNATISSKTTGSECLFAEAIKAARRSRFTMDEKAPVSQAGSITYRFVAQ